MEGFTAESILKAGLDFGHSWRELVLYMLHVSLDWGRGGSLKPWDGMLLLLLSG